VGVETELQVEQEFVDLAYERLDAMRADANRMLEGVLDLGRGGTFQSRTERDVVVRTSLARLEQLDIGDQTLTFGRIDRVLPAGQVPAGHPAGGTSEGAEGAAGGPSEGSAGVTGAGGPAAGPVETFHIGRLAVHGADHEPLVVDWRAPVAEPFYRATGRDPQGLRLRRHLALDGRKVIGVEDERFDAGGDEHADRQGSGPEGSPDMASSPDGSEGDLFVGNLALGGPGALLAALDRTRSGRMQDIVSTIQREQDEIIRAPLPGVLVVQGGPGTGKTAVALHRAAYLLYTHRFPLERQGVLVVGPNPLFLRYIEQVLPSLGETGCVLSTVSGLVSEIRVTAEEPAATARLKGDPRMARVIARAVRTRQRPLTADLAIPFGASVIRLTAAESRLLVDAARRRPGTHNARRRVVESSLVKILADRVRRPRPAPASAPTGMTPLPGFEAPDPDPETETDAGADGETFDLEDFARRLRRTPEFVTAMDRIWPRLSPHELLHDLFGAPPLIAAAARDILSPDEQRALRRERSESLESVGWTVADAALVDEARHLLGPRNGSSDAPTRTYGHIVVDEVQDLSPMQLRMLARRSLSGSMTIVGDIAQATAPWAPADWSEITAHLPARRPARTVELTVSYRTPAEVVQVASRVLAVAAPDILPPRPVRRTGVDPRIVRVPEDGGDAPGRPGSDDRGARLAAWVAAVAGEELEAVSPGRVAILAPPARLAAIATACEGVGLRAVDPRDTHRGGLLEPLVLLAADQANGLEFDAVVVVEPAEIASGGARGLRTLYVALTRPTQRLAIVHAEALPAALG